MSLPSRRLLTNHILASLPDNEYARLSANLEHVRLAQGKLLHVAGNQSGS
jgi:hypothetical protein